MTFADHHHDDRLGFWCAAPLGAQDELVAVRPAALLRPAVRRWTRLGRCPLRRRCSRLGRDRRDRRGRLPDGRHEAAGRRARCAGRSTGDRRAGDVVVRLRHADAGPAALADSRPVRPGHRPADVGGRLYDSGNGWPVAVFGDRREWSRASSSTCARADRRGVADPRRGRGHGDRHAAAHRASRRSTARGRGRTTTPTPRTASCPSSGGPIRTSAEAM